jgi:cytochrome c peroxidase
MKTNIIAILLLFPAFLLTTPGKKMLVSPQSTALETTFKKDLGSIVTQLTQLEKSLLQHTAPAQVKEYFCNSRLAYKKVEYLVEYYYPHLSKIINGPALPYADGENSMSVITPQGFQVLEEKIFTGGTTVEWKEAISLTRQLRLQFIRLQQQTDPYGFMDAYIFEAIRFEMYRIIALGISGYDSPVALKSLPEAAAALQGLQQGLVLYGPALADENLYQQTISRLRAAEGYLLQHPDFAAFDRLHFIITYANPLSTAILQWQRALALELPAERKILLPGAPHLFATSYFQPNGYSPNYESDPTTEKKMLGEKLFYDPRLSGNLQRSCASCHQREKAFTDGLAKSPSLDGSSTVTRNTPTLLNVAFQSKLFYDSRANFLESQVFEVVHNKVEMDGSLDKAAHIFQRDTGYKRLFASAFQGDENISAESITNAIASYLRSLTSLQSRFDQYMNGDNTTLSAVEKKGFNIFMGKAKCGTCHFAPLFNGVAPPYFAEPESEVLGVPASNRVPALLDKDPGKYLLYKIPIFRYAFKTTTVRNTELTAPYMHNGVFNTLEQVIDFYDKGGGAGLGIAPAHQTLPREKLQLTPVEKKALVAFIRSLTDTVSYNQVRNGG